MRPKCSRIVSRSTTDSTFAHPLQGSLPSNRRRRISRNGFTLAELLIVIVIIVLLVALLMPALNMAYKAAMKSADAALISQIAMGCESYHQIFNQYPPSGWSPAGDLWPPPPIPSTGTIANVLPLTGAAKIFSALSGFQTTANTAASTEVSCNDPLSANWKYPCGKLTFRGITVDLSSAAPDYYINEDKIYGPYYNPDAKGETMTTVAWNGPAIKENQQMVFASRFARETPPALPTMPAGGLPETGAPILYYRAAPSHTDKDLNGVIDAWDIFNYRDNFPITDAAASATNADTYNNSTIGTRHPLYASSNGSVDVDATIVPAQRITDPDSNDFGISRPFTSSPEIPYNATSFILISPGPDGLYFTEDDVTNFRQ